MSYELYQTEGIIIKSREAGDTGKILSVFTKDFGRVELLAKGARRVNSKLNPHLNLCDYSRFAFVSGKRLWRLVDAEKISSWPQITKNKIKTEALIRIILFLERMLQGEEKNSGLWRLIKEAADFLNNNNFEKDDLKVFESITILNILFLLGYIDNSSGLSAELTTCEKPDLKKYINFRPQILKIIHEGMVASDL